MEKDYTIDCFGLLCPMPIIKLSEKMKEMQQGEVVELLVTDEGSKEDMPDWCAATGNELLKIEEEGEKIKIYIKKGSE
ncbi:sulfurtransferase TusA family protein [bacterium]